MKPELNKAIGHKKAQKHLLLAHKYEKKYKKNKKQINLILCLSNLGFYHHCLAVLSNDLNHANQKINHYTQAAKTFEKITKLDSKPKFEAYTNQYLGYSSVVNAGTAQNNPNKLDYYKKASTHFSKAAALFGKAKMHGDNLLCKGWTNLTKSCAFDVQAASETNTQKRIKLSKKVHKSAIEAHKIFTVLKVNKLKKRTKSLEFASKAWITILQGKNPEKAIKLFEKASKCISNVREWKLAALFLQGLSQWFLGVYSANPKTAKKSFLNAAKLFKECNSNEMAINSLSMIQTRGLK